MISVRLLCLAQLCIISYLVNAHPPTLDHAMKEYLDGLTELNRIARELKHEEAPEDLVKLVESEIVDEPEEYDFIVVGGGTSGSVIANRLSEVPEWHVLLLEAGSAESKIGQIPAVAEELQLSAYNWGYKMQPQHHACLGMINNQCPVMAGKGLGGSTSINSMLYSRGNAIDYDRWADEELQSWCYNHVLPYFKKSEDAALEHFDNKYHNKGGPLDVEDSQHRSPLAKTFLEAGEKLGSHVVDYNGRHQLGFGMTQSITNHGKRRSTASAFLEPAAHRKNLKVLPHAHVTQIAIGDHTHEARGVKYVTDKKLHVAKAKKEVILAAGLFNSPKLLMLSGVGPKEYLEQHGIPTKVDLQGVGKNLQDHEVFLGLNFLVNETHLPEPSTKEEDLKAWLTEGKGPLTSTQNIEAIGFIKTKASKDEKDVPDIELQFVSRPFNKENGEILKRSTGISDEMYDAVWKPLEGHHVYSIYPTLLHPKSRGHVELKSKNPFHWPVIHGNHFSDPDEHDVSTMVAGIKTALELSKTEPFQKWESKLAEVIIPGCGQHGHDTDAYWQCSVRKLSIPQSQVGTCKMGPKGDKTAVVDEQLKVHGVKGLRVADNSIIPDALSAHASAPTVMIGEKAADLIKETWK